MASAVNVGSINMPKMMRHLSHRTSQVRELTFIREAIKQKDVKTTKADDSDLEGPAVSFGYEKELSTALTGTADDTVYHADSPEIVLPGLTMLQSPIVSRRGRLEKTGHRISGACTFYAPSLDYIKALDNFKDTKAFAELESYDMLIDMEKILYTPADVTAGYNDQTLTISSGSTYNSGFELDRIQFKVKTGDNIASITLNGVDGTSKSVVWTATDVFNPGDWTTVDLPVRDIEANETKEVYIAGVGKTFTATTVTLDVDKLIGGSNTSYLSSLVIATGGNTLIELRDIYLYKEAEWRVEAIKDYRDEYMQISAVRVRGERASRRRAYA